MSMPLPQDQTTWKVTGQQEYTQVQVTGPPLPGVKVFYQTGAGHSGSVFVPLGQYNVTTVRNLLNAAAAQMDAIGQLSGGAGSQ
jgi:hypothetical protein